MTCYNDCIHVQCEPVEAVPVDVPEGFSFAQAFTEAAVMIVRAETAIETAASKATEATNAANTAAASASTATAKASNAESAADRAEASAQALASVALASGLSIGVDPVDGGLNFYRTT